MKTRKFLALALALIMAFAMIPVASLAENVDGLVNILCKRSNGNHCESHDERKRKCQKFAGFHFFSS